MSSASSSVDPESVAEAPAPTVFTWKQRITLWSISWAGYIAIRLIGSTLRYTISMEDGATGNLGRGPMIYAFWHRAVFPAAYLWRNRRIRVMTSQSYDGEYIARIIEKLGFVAVRGSSSRGALRALLALRRDLSEGAAVAFTIDGPRGPMYVAKPGPVLLAKASGYNITCFYIALENPWVLKTWDRLMIPKPFTRALMRTAAMIHVPASATELEMQRFHQQMQEALDRVRVFAEENVASAACPE